MRKLSEAIRMFLSGLLRDTLRTLLILFRIMIPVSVAVKILQELGVIAIIGELLYPVMKFNGLPGEMGLVWATGMITNLFGGVIAYLNIAGDASLTVAQISVLSLMMLVAHTFPIELQIARKTGVRLVFMFFFRFMMAYVFGFILWQIYSLSGTGKESAVMSWQPEIISDHSLQAWLLRELRNYAMIAVFVFCLMLMIRLLKVSGGIRLITVGLSPVLRLLGIAREVSAIALVGLTMGVVYGGALIIDETRRNPALSVKDIFYAMALMGVCHSLIEDTILMLALGADIFGILVVRILLSVLFIWLLVRLTKPLSSRTMERLFLRPKIQG